MSGHPDTALFISGMLAAGYLVGAAYFLKFWQQTRDRLFAYFASAFGLLFVQRLVLALAPQWAVDGAGSYLIRLLAFALIIVAIVDKNRSSASRR